jgi:hypothetical protein
MPFLPYTGTFTVSLLPTGAATLSTTATLSPDLTGALVLGTPLAVNLSKLGQSALLTFGVTSEGGQTLALNLSGVSTNPSGSGYTASVYSLAQEAQMTLDTYGNSSETITTDTTLNLANLSPGSYALFVTPSGAPGTGSMQVTLQAGVNVVVPTSGSQVGVNTTVLGENVYATFTANAGQSLTVTLSNLAFSPASSSALQLSVIAPDGANVGSTSCISGASCQLPLTSLPRTGSYSIQVVPPGMNTMSFAVSAH